MAEVDLQAVHDTLVSVAFEAGRMILAANPSASSTDTKMNGSRPLYPFSFQPFTIIHFLMRLDVADHILSHPRRYQQPLTS